MTLLHDIILYFFKDLRNSFWEMCFTHGDREERREADMDARQLA